MSPVPTHWLAYGEPTGERRVEAEHRITYITGPNESREDDVTHGTLAYEGLDLWEQEPYASHVHDGGALCLSALPDDARDRLMRHFEEEDGGQ